MLPTDILSTEHKAVLTALAVLEKAGQALASGRPGAGGDLAQLLEFFRGFVDRCHHGKEEQVLFPELVRRGVPKEGGPIGVMLAEHELGREHVRRLQALLDDGGPEAAARMPAQAAAYRALLEAHIQKEDSVLFPMAARLLDDGRAQELVRDFDRIEQEHVGQGRHEAFHRMLDNLKERYAT